MVENAKCLQLQTGVITPCRTNERYIKGGLEGKCPFSACIAAQVAANPQLIERIVGKEFAFPVNSQVLELIFHAICPGLWNQNADENAVGNYTSEKPFVSI